MNTQLPQKKNYKRDIDVHSVFLTFQGEGIFAGRPAVFIRLGGCNLQCPLCDTDYQTMYRTTPENVAQQAIDAAERYGRPLFVITGGEPFRQPLALHALVVHLLCETDGDVQIETNGTLWHDCMSSLQGHSRFYIVVSPKTGNVHKEIAIRADAWKYVARAGELDVVDGLPTRALDHPASPILYRPKDTNRPIYLQPADEGNSLANANNQSAVLRSCLAHGYTFCLQIHKIVGVP